MTAIYKKEMQAYFSNPIGYVFCGIFLTLAAGLCCYTTLISKSYSTNSYFYIMIFALIILIPLLTMRSFAEERKTRTEQMLLPASYALMFTVPCGHWEQTTVTVFSASFPAAIDARTLLSSGIFPDPKVSSTTPLSVPVNMDLKCSNLMPGKTLSTPIGTSLN